mmetsp:Transcript_3216/g.7088  ORF Transcript_3216/g.7088 Transcript_3216/m.7088 type:complete len:428 (+) Transcript_3216:32-1315(+)
MLMLITQTLCRLFTQGNPRSMLPSIINLVHGLLKRGEVLSRTSLGIILDHRSITLDEVDSREAGRVQIGTDKVTLLISTEFIHRNSSTLGILGKLLLHSLAELAPRSVNGNNSLLPTLNNLQCLIIRLNVLNSTRFPKVTVKGTLSSGNVDPALGLGGTVFVGKSDETSLTLGGVVEPWGFVSLEFKVDEASGSIFWDRDGVFGVTNGRVSLGMKRMVRNFILGNIIKGIFQRPIRDRIAFGQPSPNRSILKLINPRPLKSLPPRPSINHTIGIQSLETPLEWLHLANLIVLFNVFLPKIGSVLLIVGSLISHGNTLGTKDFGFESVKVLNFTEELHSFGEEMEGVHHHDLGLSVLQISHTVKEVGDDGISRNQGVGEDGIAVVLDGDFESKHGLFFEVFETHLFGLGDEGFLVKDFGVIGHLEGGG